MIASRRRVMVVAATAAELAPAEGWRTHVCGIGPVEAAASTAMALAESPPEVVVNVGIAGVRRDAGIPLLGVVVANRCIYSDVDLPNHLRRAPEEPSVDLVAAIAAAVPGSFVATVATTAGVGQGRGADVEAMEGYAVARAAALAGVRAIEVRVISNHIDEPDRCLWRFDDAFATVRAITPQLVEAAAQWTR